MINNIEHQEQLTQKCCLLACLSMVTGVNQEKLIVDHGTGPHKNNEQIAILVQNSIYPHFEQGGLMFAGNLYLVTVPSLSAKKMLHRIIVDLRVGVHYEVYDPAIGERYTIEDLHNGTLGHTECIRLIDCSKGVCHLWPDHDN